MLGVIFNNLLFAKLILVLNQKDQVMIEVIISIVLVDGLAMVRQFIAWRTPFLPSRFDASCHIIYKRPEPLISLSPIRIFQHKSGANLYVEIQSSDPLYTWYNSFMINWCKRVLWTQIKAFSQEKSWFEADAICKANFGSRLTSIHSESFNDRVSLFHCPQWKYLYIN